MTGGWHRDNERSRSGGDARSEESDDATFVRGDLVVAVTVVVPVMMVVRGIGRVEIGVELRADREDREHQDQRSGADREGAVEQAEQR